MQTLSSILDKKFVGTEDLRRDLTAILKKLPSQGGKIVITQRGKPKAILVDVEEYLELQETLLDLQTPGFVESIQESIQEVRDGHGLTLKELKKRLKI